MSDLSLFDLTGKKALITGGAGGIGKACAIGMAKAGADVAIVDLKVQMGRETVAEIRALGRNSIFIQCDVADARRAANMVKQVVDEFGRLDIAFNNAGIGISKYKDPEYDNAFSKFMLQCTHSCSEEEMLPADISIRPPPPQLANML